MTQHTILNSKGLPFYLMILCGVIGLGSSSVQHVAAEERLVLSNGGVAFSKFEPAKSFTRSVRHSGNLLRVSSKGSHIKFKTELLFPVKCTLEDPLTEEVIRTWDSTASVRQAASLRLKKDAKQKPSIWANHHYWVREGNSFVDRSMSITIKDPNRISLDMEYFAGNYHPNGARAETCQARLIFNRGGLRVR